MQKLPMNGTKITTTCFKLSQIWDKSFRIQILRPKFRPLLTQIIAFWLLVDLSPKICPCRKLKKIKDKDKGRRQELEERKISYSKDFSIKQIRRHPMLGMERDFRSEVVPFLELKGWVRINLRRLQIDCPWIRPVKETETWLESDPRLE